jgi:hypothetical protein
MFKINWCKIFGHKTYTTERLKKRHNGTRKGQVIIICTTRCMRCGKVISKERVWTTKGIKDKSTGIKYYK